MLNCENSTIPDELDCSTGVYILFSACVGSAVVWNNGRRVHTAQLRRKCLFRGELSTNLLTERHSLTTRQSLIYRHEVESLAIGFFDLLRSTNTLLELYRPADSLPRYFRVPILTSIAAHRCFLYAGSTAAHKGRRAREAQPETVLTSHRLRSFVVFNLQHLSSAYRE